MHHVSPRLEEGKGFGIAASNAMTLEKAHIALDNVLVGVDLQIEFGNAHSHFDLLIVDLCVFKCKVGVSVDDQQVMARHPDFKRARKDPVLLIRAVLEDHIGRQFASSIISKPSPRSAQTHKQAIGQHLFVCVVEERGCIPSALGFEYKAVHHVSSYRCNTSKRFTSRCRFRALTASVL